MSMSLSEITKNMLELQQAQDEFGIDPESLRDVFESWENTFQEKVEFLVSKSNEYHQYAEVCKAEEKRLADRRQALEKRASNIKEFIKSQMQIVGANRLDYPLFTVFVQNNPPKVNVYDENAIPNRWFVEKIDRSLDKRSLLEALKTNENIPGCQIERSVSLRIK